MSAEPELLLLSHIQTTLTANPEAKQREIAAELGLSLGMTNIVLRRFANRGWILAKRLSARNIRYALTVEGMNEIAHRSYRCLRRTFAEVRNCRAAVEKYVMQAKVQGCTKVCLYGESDIAFIIEWAARSAGLEFVQMPAPEEAAGMRTDTLGITGEGTDDAAAERLGEKGCVSVYEMAGRESEETVV